MKNEQIQEFFTEVANDERFKAEVLKFKEGKETKKLTEQDVQKFVNKVLLPKAKKLGYNFSEKDLADFGNSQGLANLDKLSLEDLENVSGGVNKGLLGAMFSLAMFMGVGAGVGMSASAVGPLQGQPGAENVANAEPLGDGIDGGINALDWFGSDDETLPSWMEGVASPPPDVMRHYESMWGVGYELRKIADTAAGYTGTARVEDTETSAEDSTPVAEDEQVLGYTPLAQGAGSFGHRTQAPALAVADVATQSNGTAGDIVTPGLSGTEAGRGTATATDSALAAPALSKTASDSRTEKADVVARKRRKLANGTASEAEQPQQSGNPAQGEKRRKTTNSSGNRVVQSRGVDRTRRPGETRGAIGVPSQNHHIQNDSRCEITGTGETFIQGNGITTVSGNGRTDVAGEGAVNVLPGGTGKVSFVDDAQKEQVSLQRKHDLISLSLPGAGKFSIEGKISVSNTQLPNGQRSMQVSYDDTTDPTHPEHIFMMQFLRDGTSFLVTRNWHSTFRSLCNAVSSNAGGLTRESAKAALSDNAVKAFLFQLFANAGIDTADKMTEYFSHIVKDSPTILNHVIDQKKTWTVRQNVQRQQRELLRRNIIFLEAKQRGVQQLLEKSDEKLGQQQREALQSQNQAIERELQKLRGVNPPH